MITSNVGLFEMPHLQLYPMRPWPLAYRRDLPGWEIFFVPGVKAFYDRYWFRPCHGTDAARRGSQAVEPASSCWGCGVRCLSCITGPHHRKNLHPHGRPRCPRVTHHARR
jgi:hypothetical protein